MVRAVVAIGTAAGTSEPVAASVRGLDVVTEAHVVAGDFDVIAELETDAVRDALAAMTREIRPLDGVGTTRSYVVLE